MIQKKSCSLSTKVHWHFYDRVKICLIMLNDENIFTIYEIFTLKHKHFINNLLKQSLSSGNK